jgi:hypothetical protein
MGVQKVHARVKTLGAGVAKTAYAVRWQAHIAFSNGKIAKITKQNKKRSRSHFSVDYFNFHAAGVKLSSHTPQP